jgi:hypothetical protein
MACRTVRAEVVVSGMGRRKACVMIMKARTRVGTKSGDRVLPNMVVCAGVEGGEVGAAKVGVKV